MAKGSGWRAPFFRATVLPGAARSGIPLTKVFWPLPHEMGVYSVTRQEWVEASDAGEVEGRW